MALITDPDLLADSATDNGSTEVYIHPSNRTIKLVTTGDLSTDGVTLKCLYSFLKEEWKDDPNSKGLAALPFPMVPITDEAFELVDGWDLLNDTARYLIRTGGWTVRNTSGNVTQMWAGIIGLGSIESDDQLYYQQVAAGAATNVQLTGQINQAVQILRDDDGDGNFAEGSDFDRRTFFKLFVRERAQVFDDANLADIGVTALAAQAYRFPITTSSDALKVTTADATIASSSPWNQIKIRYFDQAFARDVDSVGTPRSFGIVIDVGTHSAVDGSSGAGGSTMTTAEGGINGADYTGGTLIVHEGANAGTYSISGTPSATVVTITTTFPGGALSNQSFTLQRSTPVVATAEQIYEKVQYDLRQNTDIDATDQTVTGKTADLLLNFVGDTLQAGFFAPSNPNGGGSGVVIEGFAAADTNRITFKDNSFVSRTYPFVAALTLQFGANLQADASAKYWVYFTRTHRKTGTDIAVTSASGETCTLTSSTTSFTEIASGEQFLASGFANAGNSGLYEATGAGGATSITVKKARSGAGAFVNEGAGPTVNLDMNPFDSTSAILVDDNSGLDMTGTVGAASVQKTFNYDGNVQGGRAAGADALITAVAIGLATGQYVRATGTVARSISNAVALVAPLERNYSS